MYVSSQTYTSVDSDVMSSFLLSMPAVLFALMYGKERWTVCSTFAVRC